jgi:hypothetical protein
MPFSDTRKYWRYRRKAVAITRALWKRWRMFRGGLRWDERDSVLVVLLLCHRGDRSVTLEITFRVLLITYFYLCTGVAGLWVITRHS